MPVIFRQLRPPPKCMAAPASTAKGRKRQAHSCDKKAKVGCEAAFCTTVAFVKKTSLRPRETSIRKEVSLGLGGVSPAGFR